MPQPNPTPFSAQLSNSTYFVAVPFARPHATVQEPKSASDTPTGANPQVPGGGSGTIQDPNQPPPPQGAPPCADNNMLIFLGLGLALMYFLVMRPENKRRKQQQEMLAAIQVGDRVVTLGGMYGEVASLTEKTLTLRVDTVKMEFDRSAIARVVRDDAPAAAAKPKS